MITFRMGVEKAAKAIDRIARFAATCNRLVLWYSGGRDSTAVAVLARQALGTLPPAAAAPVPGNSRIDVVLAVARALGYEVHVCNDASGCPAPQPQTLVVVRRGEDMWSALTRFGFPAHQPGKYKRWCCQRFKNEPLDRIAKAHGVDCALSGAYDESVWRRRSYAGLNREMPVADYGIYRTLYPLMFLGWSPEDSLGVVRRYAPEAYEVLSRWYSSHTGSPDCALCILSTTSLRSAASEPQIARAALGALKQLKPRPGTVTERKVARAVRVLEEALGERV